MTLARTALRLLTVEALIGADGARPTKADGRVFDSRIGKVDVRDENDRKPIIIVTTDKDDGDPIEDSRGGPPFWRDIDLTIELGIAAGAQEGADFVVGIPETDAELEASLDFLEAQVITHLARNHSPLPALWRRTAMIMKAESYRQATDDVGVKLANRLIIYTCRVKDDCVVENSTASGLDVLPEPLRGVAKALPSASPRRAIAEAIAKEIAPVTAPPLETVGVTFDPKDQKNPEAQPLVEQTLKIPQT